MPTKRKTTKRKAGRPSTLTKGIRDQMSALVESGVSARYAAAMLGIPNRTHHHWMAKGDEDHSNGRRNRYTLYYCSMVMAAERSVGKLEEIAKGHAVEDSGMTKWLLSKRAPEIYGDKMKHEITGKDGGPITTATVGDIDALEAEVLRAAETIKGG